jgi:hypothetical protein
MKKFSVLIPVVFIITVSIWLTSLILESPQPVAKETEVLRYSEEDLERMKSELTAPAREYTETEKAQIHKDLIAPSTLNENDGEVIDQLRRDLRRNN